MKLWSIIRKNFKLLIRFKASAFIVLLGPLLIILLVGLAFSGKSSYDLSVGYYSPEQTNLTHEFVESLRAGNYILHEFNNEEDCVKKIEQGIIHTCIIFPVGFEVGNEQSNELRFLVDYSRMNLVYKVIDSVSGILQAETQELSYSLTEILLSRINATIKGLDEQLLSIENMNPQINLLTMNLQKAKSNADAMKMDMHEISLTSLDNEAENINETIEEIKEKGLQLISETEEYLTILVDDYDHWGNDSAGIQSEFEDFVNVTLTLYNSSSEEVQSLMDAIDDVSDSLSEFASDLEKNAELNKDTQAKLEIAKQNIATIQANLIEMKTELRKIKDNLSNIDVTSAETIVSPVNTKIEPVVLETSKLTFTFPFLLVLVIMFVALLLSSTLVLFEKNSKAFFRNFITPTRAEFFAITTFLTSFIVIIIQTIIIIALANFFLQIPLFKNLIPTLLIVLVTCTFFIVLGMAVGYLFSTQEGAIMVSIVLGSVFLFLSNLVIPLESMAPALAGIIKYNPYVLASDALRKSFLFTLRTSEALTAILILLGASIVLFVIILVFRGFAHNKKIKQSPDILEKKLLEEPPKIKSKAQLQVGSQTATNKLELLKLLSFLTKAEFEEIVTKQDNKIADWAENELKDTKLASKLRKHTSKEELMKILADEIKKEKFLKRHD